MAPILTTEGENMKLDNYVESVLTYVKQMEDVPHVEFTDGDITKEMMEIANFYSIEE